MIRFYQHREIDREKWNAVIARSAYPTVFADYDFLTFAAQDWNALIEDDYVAVMPLPTRSKWGIHYLYTPYAFSKLGIFASQPVSKEKTAQWLKAIPSYFKQIDLCLNPANEVDFDGGMGKMRVSHKLDLSENYETLWHAFSENTRRNVKAAEKCDLRLTDGVSVMEIVRLFRENKGTEAQVTARPADYDDFVKVAEYARTQGRLEVWGVKNAAGDLLAGACFLNDTTCYRFWFSGRNFAYAKERPLFFLMNEFVKRHHGEKKWLDFEGSSDENVSRFYHGFGGVKFCYPMLTLSRNPLLQTILTFYRRWRR